MAPNCNPLVCGPDLDAKWEKMRVTKIKTRGIVGRKHYEMHLTSGASAASVNYQDKG